eukprot:CAMPEP_0178463872 /NCGR_PEP_ID=MMETSP0689_2-20121128/50556_1 /TAXON_ID=160604 /ORGANISM="Amphidinium massartii, Strain CS-259" /LENGTH=305 /DNA_ID=CAMNT_0020090767 /DNA_START=33 /DNA_END=948 /DNA_ORIENTATION=+
MHVESALKNLLQDARTKGHRCFQLEAVEKGGKRDIDLVQTQSVAVGSSIEAEFDRCVKANARDKVPALFVFRLGVRENVAGSRYAASVDKAVLIRQREIVQRVIPSAFFFEEAFVCNRSGLNWAAMKLASAFSTHEVTSPAVGLVPCGSLPCSDAVASDLKSFSQRSPSNSCLELYFSAAGQGVNNLQCRANGAKTPEQLSQQTLSTKPCYYALLFKEKLLFILWCPEQDARRQVSTEHSALEAHHALLKLEVGDIIYESLAEPKPERVFAEAREPQEIADAARTVDAQPGINFAFQPGSRSGRP